jgi:hypothetical protein
MPDPRYIGPKSKERLHAAVWGAGASLGSDVALSIRAFIMRRRYERRP